LLFAIIVALAAGQAARAQQNIGSTAEAHNNVSRELSGAAAALSPTSPTAGIARGERIGIAEGRVQRSALQGVRVQAALASVAAVIFGGGCSGSSSFKRCNRSR